MRGVLTPIIELWNFGSPGELPSFHFGSVSFILTFFSKWGCDINPITLGCPLSNPTFWKINGLVLSLVAIVFGRSPPWIGACLAYSKCSFRSHVNMFQFMCGYRGKRLVINLFYQTFILLIFGPFPYSITYLSRLATSYGCPSFTMSMWSYHWQFRYPFASMSL
jgi:hypothetical protein